MARPASRASGIADVRGTLPTELEHRKSQTMMRDDQEDEAPPRPLVDLDAGVVTFAVPPTPAPQPAPPPERRA